MASVTSTQEAIESLEDVIKWGVRHIPAANPAHQSTLRIACAVMELCLKFRINKEDILTIGEMVARITRSIVFQRARQDEAFQLDNLATALANTHAYLDETLEATKGWNLLIDKTAREKMAKSITTHIAQYQEDIRRAASFLLVDFNIEIVGSVDDLMQDMQAMMDKLGKMDYYISLAQSNVTPNRQVDNLLEMAIQLQRGLDHYYHNINLRNVQANHTFEASVLASFDKVVHAAKDSWRASKLTQDLPLDEMIQEWTLASDDVVYDPNNESTFLGQAVKHINTIKVADSAEFEASIRKEIKATNASIRGSIPGVSEPILWQTSEEVSFDEFSSQSDEVSVIDLATIRINAQEIDLVRVVDHGLISEMWSGMYRGTHVTIKKLRQNNATPSKLKTFIQHIQLMATFDSPFIVQLVGAAWNHPRDLMCIMEWLDGGNLREYLNATTDEVFSWQAKYEIIHHLVEGLLYLHSMNVIHSDVKSRNVLLDSLKPAKLANVNTMEMSVEDTMIAQLATFRWMAPEVILDESYSSASDIYSFGVVLAELDTHRVPYRDIIHPESGERLTDTMIIEQVATGSLQPTFNSYCPEWILFMALQCLSYNPEDRPTALQLAEIVRANLMDL
ncbi:unnamed protein product [Aphanomyces euteiches]